ncbi:MAG TPA: hypothetical protein VIU15_39285, partial [Streptomyces sp.]
AVVATMSGAAYVERALEGRDFEGVGMRYARVRRWCRPVRALMPEDRTVEEVLAGQFSWAWLVLMAQAAVFCAAAAFVMAFGAPWPVALSLYPVATALLAVYLWRTGRSLLGALVNPYTCALWWAERAFEWAWSRELRDDDFLEEVRRAVEDLLGDDRGTLLVVDAQEGLRTPQGSGYYVENGPIGELRRKMDQLDGGTIAVSGPRGAGKSTLMQAVIRRRDFHVVVPAPATYAPHDFLTSLFISVCQAYVARAGHRVPEFVRLSYGHRMWRRVGPVVRFLVRVVIVGVPAALLIGVGVYSAAKQFVSREKPGVTGKLEALRETVVSFVRDVVAGQEPAGAVLLVLAGAYVWTLRTPRFRVGVLRRVGPAVVAVCGSALCGVAFVGLLNGIGPETEFAWWQPLLVFGAMACSAAWRMTTPASTFRLGGTTANAQVVFGTAALLLPLALLLLTAAVPSSQEVLDHQEPALLFGLFVLGLALLSLPSTPWRLPGTTPRLVTACRNHLYRLQTVQSSTAAFTSSAAQLLTLGSSHSTAVTTVPPNYPGLVSEFRALLGKVAEDEHEKGNRVVVVIDEVDRLGSEVQARAFLAEIKAILGVPHAHYLISVAEDVGAAFVRRGLPHRDVTDSSLDDVLHVRACTLEESTRILRRRAPGIGDAYVALAHALSGGIPRDLIRYARRLVEIRSATARVELTDVAQTLVVEELSETLAGFRTLLAKHEWGEQGAEVLGAFRSLGAHLRRACPCPERAEPLRQALVHFVTRDVGQLGGSERQLVDEAAAYAYLSLTLLDVFGAPAFNQRREVAASAADGDLDLLAEARQELALSPASARGLVDAIRVAWGVGVVAPVAGIPVPRRGGCRVHGGV